MAEQKVKIDPFIKFMTELTGGNSIITSEISNEKINYSFLYEKENDGLLRKEKKWK